MFKNEYETGQSTLGDLLTWMELDYPAGRNLQSSRLHHCSAAGAGQHVDKLLLHIISLSFLPKSNNSVAIILLFCRIAAEDTLQECKKE